MRTILLLAAGAVVALVLVGRDRSALPWIGIAWLFGLAHLLADGIGGSPLVALVLAAVGSALAVTRSGRELPSPAG